MSIAINFNHITGLCHRKRLRALGASVKCSYLPFSLIYSLDQILWIEDTTTLAYPNTEHTQTILASYEEVVTVQVPMKQPSPFKNPFYADLDSFSTSFIINDQPDISNCTFTLLPDEWHSRVPKGGCAFGVSPLHIEGIVQNMPTWDEISTLSEMPEAFPYDTIGEQLHEFTTSFDTDFINYVPPRPPMSKSPCDLRARGAMLPCGADGALGSCRHSPDNLESTQGEWRRQWRRQSVVNDDDYRLETPRGQRARHPKKSEAFRGPEHRSVSESALGGRAVVFPDDIAGWSEDAIDGLGKLLKKSNVNADDVAYRIFSKYGDDVAESTFRGINKGVIDDLWDVDAEDLARYIKAVKDTHGVNPIDDIGEHKLLRMIDSDKVVTKIDDESIDRIAVLKKGKYDPDDLPHSFGLERIKGEHGSQFEDLFGTMDDNTYCFKISEVTNRPDTKYTKIWTDAQGRKNYKFAKNFPDAQGDRWIVVEIGDSGSVTSSFPTTDITSTSW